MVNDSNVEELLVGANPVLDPEQLRLTAEEVDARCAAILEGRGVMQTQTPIRPPAGTPGSPRWRKPALVFAISVLLVLVAVGGVAILTGGGDSEMVDEPSVPTLSVPTPSTTTPTTLPEGVLDGRITAPAYGEVPTFTATVQYYEHDPASGDPGWQATVAMTFGGPMRFEAEVLSEQGGRLALGGPGTVFFGDGSASWVIEPGDQGTYSTSDYEPFRHLFFDGERQVPAWDELCGPNPTELGIETIAGQTTTHVTCSTALEDYELWIDEATGVVMKAMGPLGGPDLSPLVSRDGYFEFTAISFGPVTTPGPPQRQSFDAGYPPFHLVQETAKWWGSQTRSQTIEIWYRDDLTVRRTVIVGGSDDYGTGSYELVADGYIGGCVVGVGWGGECHWQQLEESFDENRPFDVDGILWFIPLAVVEENCAEAGQDVVAGRAARRFECDRYLVSDATGWHAGEGGQDLSEHWYDVETGLPLQHRNHFAGVAEDRIETGEEVAFDAFSSATATLLEIDPAFPDGIFEYEEIVEPPEPPPLPIALGDVAPLFSGPLVGGGEFDLADYRHPGGSYVVVFDWSIGTFDSSADGLDLMERLYGKYGHTDWPAETGGSNIEFVSVGESDVEDVQRVVERLSLEVPTVYCFDKDLVHVVRGVRSGSGVGNAACTTPEPWVDWQGGSPAWDLWNHEPPTTTVIDPDGVVVGHFTGAAADYQADLDALLAAVAALFS